MHGVQNLEKFHILPDGTLETDTVKQRRTKFKSYKNVGGGRCKVVFCLAKNVRLEAQVLMYNYKEKKLLKLKLHLDAFQRLVSVVITEFQAGEAYCDLGVTEV